MYNIAKSQWKWDVKNRVAEIKLPTVNNKRVRYLNPAEHHRLFQTLQECKQQWLPPIIMVAVQTGLRLNNVIHLKWSQCDLENRMIIIDGVEMKNGQPLGIPLTNTVCTVLNSLLSQQSKDDLVCNDANGVPLLNRTVQRAFAKVLKEAKITNFHFHDLRHTFASYLCQKGVPLQMIGALCGHKDNRMTQRYAHLNLASLRQAIGVLDSGTEMSQLN
jgi:integrase